MGRAAGRVAHGRRRGYGPLLGAARLYFVQGVGCRVSGVVKLVRATTPDSRLLRGASVMCTTNDDGSGATIVSSAVVLAATPERVFWFHADVRNLPRLTPGPMRVLAATVPAGEGSIQRLELGPRPFVLRWVARIVCFDPPRRVVDTQACGPFRFWRHTHQVAAVAAGCVLIDTVEFRLFPGRAGALIDRFVVAPALRVLFAERHRRTRQLLGRRRGSR